MLCLYVERCFESLICWLNPCLSSLLVAFISLCFSLLEKHSFLKLNSFSIDPWQISFYRAFLSLFSIESWQLPLLSRFLGLTSTISQQIGQSIEPKSCAICLLDTSSTDLQSIEVGFYSIAARQFLDLLRPSCMHCYSHVLHLSIILSSIASCFITFKHLYGFLVPSWSSLCFSGKAL